MIIYLYLYALHVVSGTTSVCTGVSHVCVCVSRRQTKREISEDHGRTL